MRGLARAAAALIGCLLLVAAGPVASASATSNPWIPPSWSSGESDQTWLSGSATGSGWALSAIDPGTPTTVCRTKPASYAVQSNGAIRVLFDLVGSGTLADCNGGTYVQDMSNDPLKFSCDAGATWATFWGVRSDGWTADNHVYLQVEASASPCSGGWSAVRFKADPKTSYYGTKYSSWGFELHGGSVVKLELICSNGTTVTTVSSSSSTNASVSCPPGYVSVGGSLYRDGVVVSTISPPAGVTPAQSYAIGSGAGGPVIVSGGYSCDPTMAISGSSGVGWCDRVGGGGDMPDDAVCQYKFEDGTLALVPLPKADCAAWLEGIAGPSPDDPTDPDQGIVVQWLQRIETAVRQVRTAVDGVKTAVNNAADRIVTAVGSIGSGGAPGITCPPGGCPGLDPVAPSLPGPSAPAGDGGAGEIGSKIAPLTDWLQQVGAAFQVQPSTDCRGPAMPLPPPIGTIYLLNACEEPMRTVAQLTKLVATVLLVVGAILGVIRMFAGALGWQTDVGSGN